MRAREARVERKRGLVSHARLVQAPGFRQQHGAGVVGGRGAGLAADEQVERGERALGIAKRPSARARAP